MTVIDVQDFEREVIQRSHEIPVLVDFWADWCTPCRILGPILKRLAERSNGAWVLAKVNTEEHPTVALQYEIRSIPNVKLFVDGKVVNEFVGALPEYQVQRWLQEAIPSKFRKKVEHAGQLLKDGKTEDARRLLEGILEAEPGNTEAQVLLARTILFDNPQRAAELVQGIDDPRHAEVVGAVETVSRLHGLSKIPEKLPGGDARELYLGAVEALLAREFDSALRQFIELIRIDREYDDDGARKACIAIFRILGEEDEVTLKHRREFSSALYV